jgi:hypothetical protein
MHMWDPVSRVKIGGKWEQLHDCYFPQLPPRYAPWEVSSEETISWVFFEKLPLTGMGMGCFSEVFWEVNNFLDIVYQKLISYDFCTSFVFHKVKKTGGRFQVEAPWAYQCKKILGLCHSPPKIENQCGLWKKWGKNIIHTHMWVTWQTEESVMN